MDIITIPIKKMKFCIKWIQEDYDGKRVTLWRSFSTGIARDYFIKLMKESSDYMGAYFEILSIWIQED